MLTALLRGVVTDEVDNEGRKAGFLKERAKMICQRLKSVSVRDYRVRIVVFQAKSFVFFWCDCRVFLLFFSFQPQVWLAAASFSNHIGDHAEVCHESKYSITNHPAAPA